MGMTIAQSLIQEGRQEGLMEGRQEGMLQKGRAVLIRLGSKRFGVPDDSVRQTIEQVTDVDRLDRMIDGIEGAASWADVLTTA